jgi:hypothetical protein
VVPFQFLGIEPFHFVFGEQNGIAPFFVWLKSRIERSRSVHCLVGESYECGVEEKEESARVRKSARIRSFWWSESILNICYI